LTLFLHRFPFQTFNFAHMPFAINLDLTLCTDFNNEVIFLKFNKEHSVEHT